MRDHTKLRAFQLADQLALEVYQASVGMPKHELFGLTSQMRRAGVSTASNIVEGCARQSQADYLRFLGMAYGSARELEYQLSLAHRLGYLPKTAHDRLGQLCTETSKVLGGLIRSIRRVQSDERRC